MSESDVVNSCIRWLHARKIYHWRNNTGAYKAENGAYIRYGFKGSSDILGILPGGTFLALECKYGKNGLSDHQREFQKRILENGGIYVIARSIDDLERELKPLL